jgi:hypothetical protein
LTAATITKTDKAEINNPNAIFVGVEGSFFLLLKKVKKATTSGVKIITQPGLMDWLKLVAQSETFTILFEVIFLFYVSKIQRIINYFLTFPSFFLNSETSS